MRVIPQASSLLAMWARRVTIVATLALFGLGLYGMRFVPQQFFPSSDRPELLVGPAAARKRLHVRDRGRLDPTGEGF